MSIGSRSFLIDSLGSVWPIHWPVWLGSLAMAATAGSSLLLHQPTIQQTQRIIVVVVIIRQTQQQQSMLLVMGTATTPQSFINRNDESVFIASLSVPPG